METLSLQEEAPKNAESKRNNLPMGRAHQLVAKYWLVCSENIYKKIWIEKFVFVYFCSIYRCNKHLMRLEKTKKSYIGGFVGIKRKVEMV